LSKRGWAYRRQPFMTQAYKNLFPDTSASVPAVTLLRSSLSVYVLCCIYIITVFMLVFLIAHQRLLSE
jgi:hypothetical protein